METRKFDAEVGKILHLMIHSLYTNKDIFLRELISNASDACDKLRYMAISNPSLIKVGEQLKIQISVDAAERVLTIQDNGIGMSKEELIENLGTIARSGTQKFIEQLSGNNKQDMQLIGQFGVGFYSGYMVAKHITVVSKKAGESAAHSWLSSGEGEFSIDSTETDISHGTIIKLSLKDTEDEFLDKFRLTHIVNTYSDHINVPIEFIDNEGKVDILNKGSALWTRSKSDISDEQYKEFYHHVAHSPDEPWLTLHNKNEGNIEYTNLLFIPSRKPFDLFHPDRKCRVKLYVKKVFITDEAINLIPSYLRFIKGVVDSEDLPLNISRETLQHNNIIEKIKKSIIKRVVGELKKKLGNERESFEEFWQNFGAVFKEGLCEGAENKENILEVCLFRSALTGKVITLDEYISNMKAEQEHVYYYLCEADDIAKLKTSPQLEGFLRRDIDVLLFSDQVDDFWVNVENKYKDKELKSVTRVGIDLDKIQKTEEAENKEQANQDLDQEGLIKYFKQILESQVEDIKISQKLIDSPVCLTVPEGAMDIRMERFLIDQKQLKAGAAKILELNINHPLIKNIAAKLDHDNSELVKILYDQACIIEGEPINDSGAFSKRLNSFLEKAIA